MGMGSPTHAIMALVIATAFLVWVSEKTGNPAQKIGKAVAWLGIILAALLLIGQLFVCGQMCKSGQCMRMMGGNMGRMMPPPALPQAPSQ